jgi:hypothetical protein
MVTSAAPLPGANLTAPQLQLLIDELITEFETNQIRTFVFTASIGTIIDIVQIILSCGFSSCSCVFHSGRCVSCDASGGELYRKHIHGYGYTVILAPHLASPAIANTRA